VIVSSPRQLKDWIDNLAKKDNLVANTVLQNFMMERLLERICVSKYSKVYEKAFGPLDCMDIYSKINQNVFLF